MAGRVLIDIADHIARVRLNRPEKRNALDVAMFAEIVDAAEHVGAAPGVRAVVLSGEGPSFCAGLDVALLTGGPTDADAVGALMTVQDDGETNLVQRACWAWRQLPMPVIAVVHGHAFGAGLQLALAADIRIAHPDASLSVREIHWGLIPDMTGTQTLLELVRVDVAKELTFTGRTVAGEEAARLGLVTRLSDDPLPEAQRLAVEIAGRSPDAVRAAKRLLDRRSGATAADQLAAERAAVAALLGLR